MNSPALAKRRHSNGEAIENFNQAKKFLAKNLDAFDFKTIYCSCRTNAKTVDIHSCGYRVQKDPKRASRLEWEHVVPAEAFGQSFPEWRQGTANCIRRTRTLKGRKCAD
jgi:deoxyribonuclease I